jgi:hypothetical protein
MKGQRGIKMKQTGNKEVLRTQNMKSRKAKQKK